MKPSNAPEWTLNREKLWNEVKKNEKGSNWRTHRDLKLSLPIGFQKDHYLEMTKEFVKENLTDQGMVADFHIHLDHIENMKILTYIFLVLVVLLTKMGHGEIKRKTFLN